MMQALIEETGSLLLLQVEYTAVSSGYVCQNDHNHIGILGTGTLTASLNEDHSSIGKLGRIIVFTIWSNLWPCVDRRMSLS